MIVLAGARGKILDFNQRLEISIDVAHALTYLHLYAGNISVYIADLSVAFVIKVHQIFWHKEWYHNPEHLFGKSWHIEEQ